MEPQPNELGLLIPHWSYSSMLAFLSNPLAWKKKYVLKIYDGTYGPAAAVGIAVHKTIEEYCRGFDLVAAKEEGYKRLLNFVEGEIDFGKTGSLEKMIKDFNQAVEFFFAEFPGEILWKEGKVLAVEDSITEFIEIGGKESAIPAKCKIDFVHEFQDMITLKDWKIVSCYTGKDERNWKYILQAMFNYHLATKKYGKRPERMEFWECKISKNKDDSPQIQIYTIVFSKHPEYFQIFESLYNDCTRAILRPDVMFLPNPNDMFSGEDAMNNYAQGLIGVDLSDVEVVHKEKVQEYALKNYIPSAHDKTENKFITDEEKIKHKFSEFGISTELCETYSAGSTILYTMKPSRGVKMSSIASHDKDIAIALKSASVRILAPIPGTDTVGVEIGNPNRTFPTYSGEFKGFTFPIGVDSYGKTHFASLAELPHLLIAGATGSGKSVLLHTLIQSLINGNTPSELSFIMIDPKRVELRRFAKNTAYLEAPIITDGAKAFQAIKWLVQEMERRYVMLETSDHKNIEEYNEAGGSMKRIVLVIDEYADLILSDETFIESMIVKLSQQARAVGIHLVVATQRPSVDVITGIIKANFPYRVALKTASQVDSKVIIDEAGAEQLIGKGDLLWKSPSEGIIRLQGFAI